MSKEIKDIPAEELERIRRDAIVAKKDIDWLNFPEDMYAAGAKAEYLHHLPPAVQQEDAEVPEEIQAFINAQTREIMEGEDMFNFPADGLVKIAIAMYRKMELSAREKEAADYLEACVCVDSIGDDAGCTHPRCDKYAHQIGRLTRSEVLEQSVKTMITDRQKIERLQSQLYTSQQERATLKQEVLAVKAEAAEYRNALIKIEILGTAVESPGVFESGRGWEATKNKYAEIAWAARVKYIEQTPTK